MVRNHRKLGLSGALLLSLPFALGSSIYAAKPIDLSHQTPTVLQRFLSGLSNTSGMNIQELNRDIDFKQTLHIRVQETYKGYPVWDGDAVIHVPKGSALSHAALNSVTANHTTTMDGIFYDNLSADLANTPSIIFTEANAQKALRHVISSYEQKIGGKTKIIDEKSSLLVYIDNNNQAHWAYKVSFEAGSLKAHEIPAQPIYVLDAVSFKVYEEWNDMKTINHEETWGGGYGGNEKMGKLVYDGLQGDLSKLSITRDEAGTCYFQNKDVTVKQCTLFIPFINMCLQSEDSTTQCAATDPDHNNVYWNGDEDAVNGGFSPTNDALFNGAIIKDLYQTWYNVPVLLQDPKDPSKGALMLTMIVHLPFDNAYWDGKTMNFGDGVTMFYPLTSLGVAAHEISHGFTTQHSNLKYEKQSGGINEAFSDMAAQAAEYFAYGKNSWQIGPEIFKEEGQALRYMDQPSKDCHGAKPGPKVRCSLDDAGQYKDDIDVHYTSGIYNRFFYTLATTAGWDVRKAFNVMVQANAHYWTANTVFSVDPTNPRNSGACGILKAATDYDYNLNDVKAAFDVVKVKYSTC